MDALSKKLKYGLASLIMLRHQHNGSKRRQKGSKNSTIIFLSYCYLALVGKGLLQGHSGKCCSLLSCYAYIFTILSY